MHSLRMRNGKRTNGINGVTRISRASAGPSAMSALSSALHLSAWRPSILRKHGLQQLRVSSNLCAKCVDGASGKAQLLTESSHQRTS